MKLTLNFDELTVGDIEDFEAACGVDITAIGPGNMPTKALAPLIWITERRRNPAFTLEDARAGEVQQPGVWRPPGRGRASRFERWIPAFAKFYGYTPAEIRALSFADFTLLAGFIKGAVEANR